MIDRVGDFSGNYRPSRRPRPVIIQDSEGHELARYGKISHKSEIALLRVLSHVELALMRTTHRTTVVRMMDITGAMIMRPEVALIEIGMPFAQRLSHLSY